MDFDNGLWIFGLWILLGLWILINILLRLMDFDNVFKQWDKILNKMCISHRISFIKLAK